MRIRKGKRQPVSDRRRLFIDAYALEPNATRAAIAAGYSRKTAKNQGSRLLADANLRELIRTKLDRASAIADISIERTLKEIARIAYADVRKLYNRDGSLRPIHELDEDTAAQIAGVEVEEHKLNLPASRQKNLELEDDEEGELERPAMLSITRKVRRFSKERALDMCMSVLGMHKTVAPQNERSLNLSISLSRKRR